VAGDGYALKVASPELLTRAGIGDRIRFMLSQDDMDSIITSIQPIHPATHG
jgi:hypothetical protein